MTNLPFDPSKTKIIACATVIEEMQPLLPKGVVCEVLDFGLHVVPKNLKKSLQRIIDEQGDRDETLLLGYGLCSMAVVGLNTRKHRVVIPRVDDCIAIFLGSKDAYRKQTNKVPGTYYLTKGWIEVSDSPFEEHKRLVKQFGEKRADRIMDIILKHYTRLAYIKTGKDDHEKYIDYARKTANKFNLRFEEIQGSDALIRKLLYGPWDEEILVLPPGHKIDFLDFKVNTSKAGNPFPFPPTVLGEC